MRKELVRVDGDHDLSSHLTFEHKKDPHVRARDKTEFSKTVGQWSAEGHPVHVAVRVHRCVEHPRAE